MAEIVINLKNKPGYFLVLFAIQLALGSILCVTSGAYYREDPAEKPFLIKTRVRYWFATSSALTRDTIITPAYWWSPPADDITIGRTDDYKRMDASFPLFSAEVQPVEGCSAEFEVGDNSFNNGTFFQHNWLHATNKTVYLYNGVVWDSPEHRDYAVSRARATGTARQYSVNIYLRIYKSRQPLHLDEYELNHSVDLFAGYSWYENKIRLFDGYKTLSTDFFLPTPPAGPMTGLDSSAKMVWSGWRAGFREQARITDAFSAEGKIALGPTMSYKGRNFWNLETELADPGVRQSATGLLLEYSVSANWRFWKQFELEGGYLTWFYSAGSGTETYYYTDGTSWKGKLNRVKAAREGMFVSLAWKF